MAKTKRRMSAKKLTAILVPILAVVLAFMIALPTVTIGLFDGVLRDFFGTTGRGTGTSGGNDDVYAVYNESEYSDEETLKEAEKEMSRLIAGEGFVLLKNDTSGGRGLPLETSAQNKTKISLFSHSSVDFIIGGTGSSAVNTDVTLKDAFDAANYELNMDLWNFYSTGAGASYVRGDGSTNFGGSEEWQINECPLSVLQQSGVLESAEGTTACYVLSRTGGEGRDLARYMGQWTDIEEDKAKHYLEPDSVELEILDYLNSNFDNVILILNLNNVFELGWLENYPNIRSVLLATGGGDQAAFALTDILSGEVNPSGHLVDTWVYDAFSAPSMANIGDFEYTYNGDRTGYYGISYDEGIYIGYKYYETRYADKVMNVPNVGNYDYDATVSYPFGYGLSYTTFEWSDFTFDRETMTVSVSVTNTGTAAGKDVVQVYAQTPYGDYEKENNIEKSAVQLVGFAKTGLLEPGASETLTVQINEEDLISYDDVNAKTYIMSAGDYYVTAAPDAHAAIDNILMAQGYQTNGDADFVGSYNVAAPDRETYSVSFAGVEITNRFDDANYIERDQYLTRKDWEGSWPVTHGTQKDRIETYFSERNGYMFLEEIDADTYAKLRQIGTAEAAGNPVSDSEITAEMAGSYGVNNIGSDGEKIHQLIDLRGIPYDDVDWDAIVSCIPRSDVGTIINLSGYTTEAIEAIAKPKAIDLDGTVGLNQMVGLALYSIAYPAEITVASSWNTDLAEVFGSFIAEDCMLLASASGWYAPAMNTHRTPFSGRNFEYYAEDPFLSGTFAAEVVRSVSEKGVYAFIKHFALNDQETRRDHNGMCSWSNEQAIREIYLKPFEMVARGGTVTQKYLVENETTGEYEMQEYEFPIFRALMTSYNRIGATWTGGNYNLLTGVVRGEWGFDGMIITDYSKGATSYMHTDQLLRAGADVQLTQYGSDYRASTPADIYYSKQALSHVLYTVVNSNAMNGFYHGVDVAARPFAYYYLIIIAVEVIGLAGIAWGTFAIVRRFRAEKAARSESTGQTEGDEDAK